MQPYNYCVYPFNYPHIGHKGIPALCCNNAEHRLPYNIKSHRLDDIWQSPEIQEVRETLIGWHCPSGCEFCFDKEEAGVRSFRQKALRGTFGTNEPFEDTHIRALDLRLGSTCNLACIMCTSYSSVQLYKKLPEIAKQYGWDDYRLKDIQTRHDPSTMDWADHESSWQNIFSGIDSRLQHVYMAGGEPFYVKNFEDVLHNMMGYAPLARYVINTNGTRLLKPKDIQRFKQYNLELRISIDGLGKVDEYVRHGTVWDHKTAVMDQYYKNFKIEGWDLTLNSLSIRQAPKLIEWLKLNYPDVPVYTRPSYGVDSLFLWRLPVELRQETLAWFQNFASTDTNSFGIDSIISELEKPYEDFRWRIRQVVDFWDSRGSVKLADIDPVLNKYIHED